MPGWWHEIDRKFRDREIVIEGELLPVSGILDLVSKEVGFPVRVGPELAAWAEESRIALPAVHAPARSLVESLAGRLNLEIVLTADALLLHQRGRSPENRLTRAGRVQWALLEAEERRAGKREEDPAAADLRAMPVEMPLEGVPLREAARRLGEKIGTPVYMDSALWNANVAVTVPPGERALGDLLDRVIGPQGAAWDLTGRRVVLFKPVR